MRWLILTLAGLLQATASFAAQNDAAQTLPPLETVLQRVAQQAKKEDAIERTFKENYRFTRSKVTEHRNADGELKKREEKVRTSIPVVAPVAPRSVTAGAKSPKQNAGADEKFDPRGDAIDKKDVILGKDLLSRFDFTLVRRDVINGRPSLVVDFKPSNKPVPERSIKDKFINKAAGRAWVDEEDYALVKADLYLTERVNVIGGLVGAVWKFTYGFDRERTSDGLWYVRSANWHLEGREVFVQRTIDYHEERTDVRKVRDSSPDVGPTAKMN